MIVEWGLESLPGVLRSLSVSRPLLVSTSRWQDLDLPIERRFFGCLPHAEITGVDRAVAELDGADCLVALGGGSVIDTAKAVSARGGDLPIVSIPTTYSGAEWTDFYGVRDIAKGLKNAGAGARVEAIIYEADLTLGLSAFDTCGAAMNALAHCAEALYSPARNADTDRDALAGAAMIAKWLPKALQDGQDRHARKGLLEGAMHGGASLRAGMGLGHAMAQALGGGFGLPHGPMNAVCLPHALDFNRDVAAEALNKLADALDGDPVARTGELGRLGCPMRLRDYDVDRSALAATADKIVVRAAARSNPRPASAEQVLELLEKAW